MDIDPRTGSESPITLRAPTAVASNSLGETNAATDRAFDQWGWRSLSTLHQCCFEMLSNVNRLSTRQRLHEMRFEALSGACTVCRR